jgi:hypothetical protein
MESGSFSTILCDPSDVRVETFLKTAEHDFDQWQSQLPHISFDTFYMILAEAQQYKNTKNIHAVLFYLHKRQDPIGVVYIKLVSFITPVVPCTTYTLCRA